MNELVLPKAIHTMDRKTLHLKPAGCFRNKKYDSART